MSKQEQEIQHFVTAARAFCFHVRSAKPASPASLRAVQKLLADLYAAGLHLSAEPADGLEADPRIATEADALRASWSGSDERFYWVVLDPWAQLPEEPAAGDLADDLADIYTDIRSGLAIFDTGGVARAVWHWTLLRPHWSGHALSALCALEGLIARTDGQPREGAG